MRCNYLTLENMVKRKICYGIVQPGQSVTDGIPVIKVNNLISGLKSLSELDTTTRENEAKYIRTRLHGGELIISVVGTIGKTAIVPKSFAGCNLVRATALIDIEDALLSKWVKYYIDSPYGQSYIEQNLNTTVQPTLNIRSLEKMSIPLYDAEYMKKIVILLSSLDEKIAINREINDNLEQQTASLYFSMFVSYDYYANMEFEDSEFGRIPKGWQVLSLDDVTINIRDRVHNNNYRVLSALNSGILQPSDEYFTKQVFSKDISNYIIVAENDFAYNPARVNIGSLGINDLGYTGCVSPVYVVFRTENNYQNFMRFFVKSKRFQEEVKTRASGSVRQAMNYADFSLIRLVYPPKSAIDEFNDMVEPIWKNIKHLRQENEKLSELRDSLLPKLMSGEIDVSAVQL